MARLPGIRQAPRVKPICKDCGHGHNLVWMHDTWLCPTHLKIRRKGSSVIDLSGLSAESRDAIEEQQTQSFHELFPNRRARRFVERQAKRG